MRVSASFALAVSTAWACALDVDPARAARVLVLDDPAFVDTTSGGVSAESDNVQASLVLLGHEVSTIGSSDGSSLAVALAEADVFVVPELENGNLVEALDSLAHAVLTGFVSDGGGLVVHGTTDDRATALLNGLFGLTLNSGVAGPADLMPETVGTAFDGGPMLLADNDRTRGVDVETLPPGALAVYRNGTRATVARLGYGGGRVFYLGWDWYAAIPVGSQDGGWLDVLDRAMNDALDCSPSDGAPDADADGIPDACDSYPGCADPDGQRVLGEGSRLVLKRLLDNGGADALAVAADVFLPADRPFSQIDPRVVPFRLVIRAADGSVRVAEHLPLASYDRSGRVGWRYKPRAKRWVFLDRSGFVTNGLRQVSMKDLGRRTGGRVRISVVGKSGSYPLSGADAPVGVGLVIGDEAAGECAESAFFADQCRPSATGRRIKCKL